MLVPHSPEEIERHLLELSNGTYEVGHLFSK